jgi:hypothetical protein
MLISAPSRRRRPHGLNIGRRTGQPIGFGQTFSGGIDELSFYNRALSANEIFAIYNAGSAGKRVPASTPFTSSLILNLPFDGNVADVGPNNFSVITNGGGVFVSNRFAQTNSAIALNGANQNLSIPFDARLNPTEFTFSSWANFSSLSGTIWRSGNASTDAWRGFGLTLDGGVLTYQDFTGSSYNAAVYASSNLVVGNWYHIVVTRTTNTCVVYVNGVPTGSQTNLTPYAKTQTTPMSFGSNLGDPTGFTQFCPVTLDNIHLYGRALAANEVAQLFQFEAPIPSTAMPFITTQPTNQTITISNAVTFAVLAGGSAPLGYQWYFNGTNILNATNATLTINSVTPALAGNYSVLVYNSAGTIISSNALLTVFIPPAPPSILAQTPSQVVLVSNAATFTVTASGTDPKNYFWSRNNRANSGATNLSYTLPSAQLTDSGSKFSCRHQPLRLRQQHKRHAQGHRYRCERFVQWR